MCILWGNLLKFSGDGPKIHLSTALQTRNKFDVEIVPHLHYFAKMGSFLRLPRSR